jgi:hypothetical protein
MIAKFARGGTDWGQLVRRRWIPFAAGATAAALTAGAIATAGGGSAGAATLPQAQSAGNFVDATLGNKPIDDLAKLQYASAKSPGTPSVQNPLDVTALNAIHLPLTGSLQLPQALGANLGAVNQVAVARSNGSSYGGSGAVANSGGISIGGDNSSFPGVASLDLCAAKLTKGACGSNPLDALGEVKLTVGAVAAVASTPQGFQKPATTDYRIASLDLVLSSPGLGQLLGTLSQQLNQSGLATTLTNLLSSGNVLPKSCDLTKLLLPDNLDLGNGITISATNGKITISLGRLLDTLGFNINKQPANTDLLTKLLDYLTSVDGLTTGVENVINGLVTNLESQFNACSSALTGPLANLLDTLNGARTTFEQAVNNLVGGLSSVPGGTGNPLAPIGTALKNVLDIGVNVQPNGPSGSFRSALSASPKQGTPAVPGQTVVRAIEIDLVGDPLAAVALGNAAAGPSSAPAPVAVTSSSPPQPDAGVPATNIPTGVPAGLATPDVATPVLPITLVALGLMFAAGGVAAFKYRGRLGQR